MSDHKPTKYRSFTVCAACEIILAPINRDKPCRGAQPGVGARKYIDNLLGVDIDEIAKLKEALKAVRFGRECWCDARETDGEHLLACLMARAALDTEMGNG